MRRAFWKTATLFMLISVLGCSPGVEDADPTSALEEDVDRERARAFLEEIADLEDLPTVADHGPLIADLDVELLRLPSGSPWAARGDSLSVRAVAGDWNVRLSVPASDPAADAITTSDLHIDLADIQGVTMRTADGELIQVGGSLTEALDRASTALCGDVFAAGYLDVSGVPIAVEFSMELGPDDVEIDPSGVCEGVVWGADDCNDGKCTIIFWYDSVGLAVRARCLFYDIEWNPWNYCGCRL